MTYFSVTRLPLLLLCALLLSVVTTGFMMVRQASDNTVALPIEVIGPDGYTQSVTVNGSNASQARDLYLKAYSIGYPYFEDYTVPKASIRINGGAWTDVTNTIATCEFPELNLDCINGPYPTIRFEIPVDAIGGSLQDGVNTIDFRFNYAFPSDSPDNFGDPSTGYRILDLELRDGGDIDLIDGTSFVWDDPATWTAPDGYGDAQSIAEGEQLWNQRNLLTESWNDDETITASCGDCHASDGRDLAYFAFSNWSIIARSEFHGLSVEEGKKIAAFIRSYELKDVDDGHTYDPPARPWTPVYQPGPTSRASRGEDAPRDQGTSIEDMPSGGSQYWAAGAGLEWALDNDSETLGYLFPNGVDRTDVDVDTPLKMWDVPVALQFADWNEWLPTHHPLDIWGDDFINQTPGPGYSAYNAYYGENVDRDWRYDFLSCWNGSNDGSCVGKAADFQDRMWEDAQQWGNRASSSWVEPAYTNMTDENEGAFRRVLLQKWAMVKTWEIMHTYDMADETRHRAPNADILQWPGDKGRTMFENAPHLKGTYAGGELGSWDLWLDNMWYEIGARVHHGKGLAHGIHPNDWRYQFMHIGDYRFTDQALRTATSYIKLQEIGESAAENSFNDGAPRMWFQRDGHLDFGSVLFYQVASTDNQLSSYQAGLARDVFEAMFREQVEVMMYRNSPDVTYDQSTGSYSGDTDANWSREYGEKGWEPASFTPSFDDGLWNANETPSHYLNTLNQLEGLGVSPTLLDSAAAWLDAMNPADVWDDYRCQSVGGLLDCASSVNQSPSVSITSPSDGSTFTDPSSITLETDPSDPDGTVSSVEFFAGDTKLGEDTDAPFAYTWSGPAPGTYSLTAQATDNDGLTTTSEVVSITVEEGGATVTQAIPLAAGWNLISSHVAPDPADMPSVFGGVSSLEIVRDEIGNVYRPENGTNDIGSWSVGESYMVFVTSADTLSLSGTAIAVNSPIALSEGWNFVPYYPGAARSPHDALGSIANELVMVKDQTGAGYIPSYNIDQIGELKPGQGYKVYVNSGVELIYEEGTRASMTSSTAVRGSTLDE